MRPGQAGELGKKARGSLVCITKGMASRSRDVLLPPLFCPDDATLEYFVPFWALQFKRDRKILKSPTECHKED